jgi:hypothetical protein
MRGVKKKSSRGGGRRGYAKKSWHGRIYLSYTTTVNPLCPLETKIAAASSTGMTAQR